jgi:predicted nucleic acid-binding protein
MLGSPRNVKMTEPAYIDTSCVLKLVLIEPDSEEIRTEVKRQADVILSSLCELEARSRLLAFRSGGRFAHREYLGAIRELETLLEERPFRSEALAGTVFDAAIAEVKARGAVPCRSLDRLHIAAMQTLGASILLTTDVRQAAFAKSLGMKVRP